MTASVRQQSIRFLAACVAGMLLLAAGLMTAYTLHPGSQHLAQSAIIIADAQIALRRTHDRPDAEAQRLGIRWLDQPPGDSDVRTPLGRAIRDELQAVRPNWHFVIRDSRQARIFVSDDGVRWIAIPFRPLGDSVLRAAFWIALAAALCVGVAGAWFARRISRPLESLVARADALLDGQIDRSAFRDAPLEVAALADRLAAVASDRVRAQRQREAWLAGLSHDLRTPLARLRFAAELHADALADALPPMVADIEEMDALIGQFISLIREGKEEAASTFDLAELLHSIVAAFASQTAIELALPNTDTTFDGRAFALRRAVGNLVQNALNHGAAPIRIALDRDASDWRIAIDNAPKPDLAQSGAQGFGIGLSVVRMVAELHGGSFAMAHHDDGATTATIRLPTART